MKLSVFNSIIRISEHQTLLFNALSGKFLPIKSAIDSKHLEKYMLNNGELRNALINAGMLIEESTDEIETLKTLIQNADNNRDEYILHINPTLDCNFKCWYCYENHTPHSKMSASTIDATKKFIDRAVAKGIKRFDLGFFGGEPLFHFHFIAKPLIEYAAKLCGENGIGLHIHFTSNGALLNDKIIEFLSQFSCGFQITLDGDKNDHDKTRFFKNGHGSYERIVNNIVLLAGSGISVIVRINYTSANINESANVLGFFKGLTKSEKKQIQFDFQRVWQERSNEEDETEQKVQLIRDSFRKEGFIVLTNYIPHNVKESCYGDKINHLLINYDGLVFGCTARDFIEANCIGKLSDDGSITYKEPVASLRCSSKFSKPVCHTCRIAPLCGGGCKQRALESLNSPGCPLGYTEEAKDNLVLDLFEHSYGINNAKR